MTGQRVRAVAGLSRRRFAAAAGAVPLCAAMPARGQVAPPERWTIVYAASVTPSEFRPYRTVALDALRHSPTRVLNEQGKTVYARLNLFEIEENAFDFRDVEAARLLIDLPMDGARRRRAVDLRDPRWTRRVIETYAPFLLHKGFHGLLLNGLHRAAAAERGDPVRYKGLTEAAANLVLSLRRHYPEVRLALKHVSPVLAAVETALDAVVAVGIMGDVDPAQRGFRAPPADATAADMRSLQELKRRRPAMTIFTLDHWNPADSAGIARIYGAQRRNGFVPYVAGAGLESILPEPIR